MNATSKTVLACALAVFTAQLAAQTRLGGFPSVDSETQRARDQGRETILQNELLREEELLAEVEKRQTASRGRFYPPKVLEEHENQIALHKRNIEMLNREIAVFRSRQASIERPLVVPAIQGVVASKKRLDSPMSSKPAEEKAHDRQPPSWDTWARAKTSKTLAAQGQGQIQPSE